MQVINSDSVLMPLLDFWAVSKHAEKMALFVMNYRWRRVLERLDTLAIIPSSHQLVKLASLVNLVYFRFKRTTSKKVQLQNFTLFTCINQQFLRKPEDFIALTPEQKHFLTSLARVIVHCTKGHWLVDFKRFFAIKLLRLIVKTPESQQGLLLAFLIQGVWHSTRFHILLFQFHFVEVVVLLLDNLFELL